MTTALVLPHCVALRTVRRGYRAAAERIIRDVNGQWSATNGVVRWYGWDAVRARVAVSIAFDVVAGDEPDPAKLALFERATARCRRLTAVMA